MIYTSYFERIREVPNPISIARRKPFWTGPIQEIEHLAPSEQLLQDWKADRISESDYISRYHRRIKKFFTPEDFRSMFFDYYKNDADCTLMCWEKSGFCHRHLLARIIINSGIPCEEWK
jgi:hypothetical protein